MQSSLNFSRSAISFDRPFLGLAYKPDKMPRPLPLSPNTYALFLEHRLSLMADEQVVHVVCVLFLLRQDSLEQHARGRVLVSEIAHHLAVRLDGDALGDQVFLDHVDQVPAFDILRCCAGYDRSEEHTSELQSLAYLVCRLLLEKKK